MNASAIAAAGGGYDPGETWSLLLRAAVALLVLIPLIYGVTRLYGKRVAMGGRGRALRVVDALALGPNRAVYLVEVGDRILVLGATAQHISLLAEVTDPVSIATLKRSGIEGDNTFWKVFSERLAKRRGEREGEDVE